MVVNIYIYIYTYIYINLGVCALYVFHLKTETRGVSPVISKY